MTDKVPPVGNQTPRSEMAVAPGSREVQLPKVTINKMTKRELKEFIPQLLKIVTGREDVWYSRRSAKPDWWPAGVNWATSRTDWFTESYWTDNLRSVVRSCYKHMGKEDLLYDPKDMDVHSFSKQLGNDVSPIKPQSYPPSPFKQLTGSPAKPQSYPGSPLKMPTGMYLPFSAEVFICFFCESEFYNKEEMRAHQIICRERPPQLQSYGSVSPNPGLQQDPPAISPKPNSPSEHVRLPLDKFTDYMDLVPLRKAAKLKRTRNSLEINCDNLGDLGPQCPLSPVTPRTPKSLISQLSREDATVPSRKRLSYSMSTDKESVTIESEPESSESENDEAQDTASSKPKDLNLLSIDITSLLGQRVRNHVHVEAPVQVVDNSEVYCKTPVKNSFLEKLRKKPPSYPVLYKPRRIANLNKQNHLYRFSKRERREFYEYLTTGLNKESRDKLKKMKKLRIKLPKLTKVKMMKWVPRKVLEKQLKGSRAVDTKVTKSYTGNFVPVYASYPSGPILLSKNVDKLLGLKKRSAERISERLLSPLSVGNYVSEEMEGELSKLKLTLYRSLLYEVEEYKSGRVTDLMGQWNNTPVKSVQDQSTSKQLNKTEIVSPVRDYVPIAERVFQTDDEVKPKGGMSVLRALLRKNKEDIVPPQLLQMKPTTTSASKTKSPGLDGVSKSLKTDVLKAFKANEGSSERSSPSSSCLSSPSSVQSCDEDNVSGKARTTKVGNKTPVLDDSLSIISMSSDGESPILNCCAGCNKKVEIGKTTIPPEKDLTEFLKPLTVKVDSDFNESEKIKSDLQIDTTYGVPSPVPSTSESPLPSTPVKKSIDLKEQVKKIMEEDLETIKRSTRSNGPVILPTYDELTDFLRNAETSMRENRIVKLESEKDDSITTVKVSKLMKVPSEKLETLKKQENKNSQLMVKKVSSPKSSPLKARKESLKLEDSKLKLFKELSEREKALLVANDQNLEILKNRPKIGGSLLHALDGSYWSASNSRRKEVKQTESPVGCQSEKPEKVPPVKPMKKSLSLTPSPSPKKSEKGDLKKSFTDTPKSSPRKTGKKGVPETSLCSRNESLSTKDSDSEKTVIQLHSSTLLTPTKMTIKTRSVSVDSNGKLDDNPYSLRSGNFVMDSPRKNGNSPRRSISELGSGDKASSNVHSPKKESGKLSQLSAKTGYNVDVSQQKQSVQEVSKKIDFSVNANLNVVHASSPQRPKRRLTLPAEDTRPAKLRKVSSDVAVKINP